jgi:hypothetical protein
MFPQPVGDPDVLLAVVKDLLDETLTIPGDGGYSVGRFVLAEGGRGHILERDAVAEGARQAVKKVERPAGLGQFRGVEAIRREDRVVESEEIAPDNPGGRAEAFDQPRGVGLDEALDAPGLRIERNRGGEPEAARVFPPAHFVDQTLCLEIEYEGRALQLRHVSISGLEGRLRARA